MDMFAALGKWFWLVCILVTFLNGAIFWIRAKKRIQQSPKLANGYRTIIKGFVTWGILPWVVMGVGFTIGGVPSVWHYFNPRDGNGYIPALFASVVLVWISGSYWIFFRGGAKALVDHPEYSRRPSACWRQAEYDRSDSLRQNSQRLLKFLLN